MCVGLAAFLISCPVTLLHLLKEDITLSGNTVLRVHTQTRLSLCALRILSGWLSWVFRWGEIQLARKTRAKGHAVLKMKKSRGRQRPLRGKVFTSNAKKQKPWVSICCCDKTGTLPTFATEPTYTPQYISHQVTGLYTINQAPHENRRQQRRQRLVIGTKMAARRCASER